MASNNPELEVHFLQTTEDGKVRFKCQKCGHSSTTKQRVISHLKARHNIGKLKPFGTDCQSCTQKKYHVLQHPKWLILNTKMWKTPF